MTNSSVPKPFADLDVFLALPRASGLAVSPDGSRAVTTISELNDKRTEFVTAVWELDVTGERPARRLTRGAKGESSPVFAAGGDLLFVAIRDVPGSDGEDEPTASLWRLPAAGGEAAAVLELSGGIDAVHAARDADVTLVTTSLMPSARSVEDDERVRALRKDNKVSALLHTGYPVRHWDHDIGPAQPHLIEVSSAGGGPATRDLTPHPGQGLRDAGIDVSADGRFAVSSWAVAGPVASLRQTLVRVDVATGERTTIADDPIADLGSPAISPDGSAVAFIREVHSTPKMAPRITLCYLRFGEEFNEVATDWDRWPTSVAWAADGSRLIVTADERGRGPIFAVDPADSSVTRLTHDDFTYVNVCPAPGGVVYAVRSSYASQPHPVRIDPNGVVLPLPCLDMPALPGELIEMDAVAEDGSPVRSWLVLPEGDEPAPLVLWIHGGPLASWNTWHWRWNPWLLAERGYAVLMPDPALSTGYGQDFIQRGWGSWGFAPYTDLMAATDEALRHPRIDETRTAAMGGSFGGYMANWIAGHTDRFDAIVTHASLWALDQFGPTTDGGYWWAREMTTEMAELNSPHRSVGEISTPTLVIHGDKDYRVPIGEGLRLWFDLLTQSALPAADDGTSPHQFLYFPTEGHWVLAPQHAKIWYEVVLAFLGRHLLGEDAELPEILG
ncbi:prolyl oligopeptidase family serine peptidase [Mycolicibacterium hodleri]|uniref:S9 family peptidase n=1 Tax=Mycolicibacterium hodleri TaxID=49897 RepID=A0A502EJL2_9MYCO|nr:prolyl oligopeptidase family serine peptidase [Mycolicibacterium hodleri]TPG37239.1 S9 family peptidase [Mycolicibacterium hodleri]